MMSNQYWFKPKRFGYGATPTTWEGWAVSIGAAAAILASIVAINTLFDPRHPLVLVIWGLFVVAVTVWYVRLCRRKTEGEWRWRWGRRANERFGA